MKNKILVSIIIPHYKRLDFTLRAIESINRQVHVQQTEIQIIVSDEEYNKETEEKLRQKRSDVVYIKNFNQEGPGGNRQSGLQKAKGDFILFLDSDDQLASSFLSEMISIFQSDQKSAAVICMSKPIFENGFSIIHKLRLYPLMLIRDTCFIGGLIFNHGILYPGAFYLCQLSHMVFRGSFVKNLKFNYDYRRGGEDWDFIIQAQKFGPIKIVPRKLLLFCYSPGSSTFKGVNLKNKWKSYSLLASRLKNKYRQGIFYQMFLQYIKTFSG